MRGPRIFPSGMALSQTGGHGDVRPRTQPVDAEMLDLLDKSAMSYEIVLTKKDEVKGAAAEERLGKTRAALAARPAAYPEVLFTSAHSGEGVPELRASIARLVAERKTSTETASH